MYASNEDEFNSHEDEWVVLKQAPAMQIISDQYMNLNDHHHQLKSTSSSSNDGNSSRSLSKCDRNDSLSSLSSIEHDDVVEEAPALISDHEEPVSTVEIQEESTINDKSEIAPVSIENDSILNTERNSSDELILSSATLRQRTGNEVQRADIRESLDDHQSLVTTEYQLEPLLVRPYRPRRNNAWIVYGIVFTVFVLFLIFGRIISSQRVMINKIMEELDETNERLNDMKIMSMRDVEERLRKEFDERYQWLINQKIIDHNNEKHSLLLKVIELHQTINFTQQNLTNSLVKLSNENELFKQQIIRLEHRLQMREERCSEEKRSDTKDAIDTKESSWDMLLSSFMKETVFMAENTSTNLSELLKNISTSIVDIVDRRYDYFERSKQILSDISSSQAAEQVKETLRRTTEHISASLNQTRSNYLSWMGVRAQQREQARMNNDGQNKEKEDRHPWRWFFRRGQDREQIRHQTPITTKTHERNKEYFCHTQQ